MLTVKTFPNWNDWGQLEHKRLECWCWRTETEMGIWSVHNITNRGIFDKNILIQFSDFVWNCLTYLRICIFVWNSDRLSNIQKENLQFSILFVYRYPERRGGTYQPHWFSSIWGFSGREYEQKLKCERNVMDCVRNSPMVKLMMGALKSSGCPIDLRRHITCEVCDVSVSGGYDPEFNQIVVCQNMATNKGMIQGILTHEMIHMFDYCNNDLDFKNIDHLACTEIRAANLTHCSFLSAFFQGDASIIKIQKAHQVNHGNEFRFPLNYSRFITFHHRIA